MLKNIYIYIYIYINENIDEVALENKIGQQKSTCVVCDSRKLPF